jgi:uncharacterized protein YqhQ
MARFVPLGGWRALIEGVFKLVMLVGYMALVSRMKEIARMFRYMARSIRPLPVMSQAGS